MNVSNEVWIVAYHFHPVWSGPAERFVRYGKYFAGNRYTPIYFTIPRQHQTEGVYQGFPLRFSGKQECSLYSFVEDMLAQAREKRPKVILVLLADWKNTPSIQKTVAAGIPILYINTMIQKKSESSNPLKRWISNHLNLWYYNSFSKIICSTGSLAQAMNQFGVSNTKIEVISNGVDLTRFTSASSQEEIQRLREELNIPSGFVALFVGLRLERKGVVELIRGWKLYKENGGIGSLLLVGDEQRENSAFHSFYQEWDKLMATVEPKHNIILQGPSKSIEKYFKATDLFVFLSKKEGMPNVLTEAMASKLPILLAPFEGFSSDWGKANEHFFFLSNRSPEAIRSEFERIIPNEELRQKVAETAFTFVKENHEISKSIHKYTQII
jgi:glycosyltransferase involved in cell wall biosynthesis